jgi:hypothetical protein
MCEDAETRNARCVTGEELVDSVNEGYSRRSEISYRCLLQSEEVLIIFCLLQSEEVLNTFCLLQSEEVLNTFMHRIEETPSTPRAQIMRMAFGEDRTT